MLGACRPRLSAKRTCCEPSKTFTTRSEKPIPSDVYCKSLHARRNSFVARVNATPMLSIVNPLEILPNYY
jgi:hypothetical protein